MKSSNWKFKLGLSLIILSVILFVSLPVIPFLKIENKVKISVSTVILSYLNPKNWFKRSPH
jgi:uncharacterized membrane protein